MIWCVEFLSRNIRSSGSPLGAPQTCFSLLDSPLVAMALLLMMGVFDHLPKRVLVNKLHHAVTVGCADQIGASQILSMQIGAGKIGSLQIRTG